MVIRLLGIVFVATALGGCAQMVEKRGAQYQEFRAHQLNTLAEAEPCRRELDELSFRSLPGGTGTLELGSEPPRVFDAGKAYFEAVRIPVDLDAPALVLKSRQFHYDRTNVYYLQPSIIVYDERMQELAHWSDMPLCYSRGWGEEETGVFAFVPLPSGRPLNLLVYSSPASWSKVTRWHVSVTVEPGVTAKNSPAIPHGPAGFIEVRPFDAKWNEELRKACWRHFPRTEDGTIAGGRCSSDDAGTADVPCHTGTIDDPRPPEQLAALIRGQAESCWAREHGILQTGIAVETGPTALPGSLAVVARAVNEIPLPPFFEAAVFPEAVGAKVVLHERRFLIGKYLDLSSDVAKWLAGDLGCVER